MDGIDFGKYSEYVLILGTKGGGANILQYSPNRILRRLSDFHGSEKMSETSTGRNVNFVCPLWRNGAATLAHTLPNNKNSPSSTTDGTHLVVPISSSIIVDCFLSHPRIHKIRIYVSFANKIKDE